MRDRLIELLKTPNKSAILRKANPQFVTDETDEESIVADHLLANGVIVPPCKVGDVVYRLCRNPDTLKWYIQKEYVYKISIHECYLRIYLTPIISFIDLDIGEKLFLTKEEAERALKESEG